MVTSNIDNPSRERILLANLLLVISVQRLCLTALRAGVAAPIECKKPVEQRFSNPNPQSTKGLQTLVTARKNSLIPRLWLTGVVIGQIILTPMAAFSITYLFEFAKTDSGFSVNFQQAMIPWIVSASLAYGMIALALALMMGGFMPQSVVRQGGWLRAFGLMRGRRDAEAVAQTKIRQFNSPQGQMTRMINQRYSDGYGLLSIHGGLVLLAIPFQLAMVVLPLSTILLIPETWMAPQRMLEFALISYIAILIFMMQVYPKFANRYVTFAAFTRRWLISMTKLSWLAPILVLWLLGRLASLIVVTWIGPDIGASIAAEKALFENWLNIGTVPENSFLDLLTALAVMPLSAFTTLTVLGGGKSKLPEWLMLESQDNWSEPDDENKVISGDNDTDESRGSRLLGRSVDIAAGAVAGAGLLAGGALVAGQAMHGHVASGGQADALDFEPSGGGQAFSSANPDGGSGAGDISGNGDEDFTTEMMMSMFERFD
jgi:hypothetical protein